ncbi:MAG: SDR family NAD(P)-dependent oxidoreductase, partial [bacterium]|nr:SDR family NAD(P)-dependent oxidoreductase [bacterium]
MKSLTGLKIIVTGGAGFIGSHIVDAMLSVGVKVTVVDNISTGRIENLSSVRDQIEFIQGDICDMELMKKACAGAYAIVHQAALPSVPKSIKFPIETHHANVTGTLSVFEAAKLCGVDRVVYASSSSVYGDTPTLPKIETMRTSPLSPYAVHKHTGE